MVACAPQPVRAKEDQLEIGDLRVVLDIAGLTAIVGVIGFVLSEAWGERQRQAILRRRREALSDQRKAIQQWVTEKRG